MNFCLTSIAELAHELEKHVEALGFVLLYDYSFENQILAEISLTEDPTIQIEYLTYVRNAERNALAGIRHWHESRNRSVLEWCQSFARSWVKAQRNKSDAYTCQLDELFYIGETEEVIEEILANKQYREILENYAKAVRRSERYNWLSKQIEHIRSQKLYDEIKDIEGVTLADEKETEGAIKPPTDLPANSNDQLSDLTSQSSKSEQFNEDCSQSRKSASSLTERERVLIYCYQQGPPILRGQPGYEDYLKYARPGDRIAYPNDSERKAKSLIRSIEKILPHLTDSEKQQAQNEIDTIKANFRNRL